MSVYLVHWTGVADDVRVARFATMADAKSANLPADRSGFEVENESDLNDAIAFSRATLTRVYNALADDPVTKMASQEVAKRRLFTLLVKKYHNLPLETQNMETHTEEHIDPKVTAKAAKAAAAAEKKAAKEAAAAAAAATPDAPKAPGVIATLKELLQEGGGTVDELFQALKGRFPDRGDGMLTTVKVQLQALPKKDFAINKTKNEDGKTVYSAAA